MDPAEVDKPAGSGDRAVMDRYFAAWGRGDIPAAMRCYSEDVVMRLPGRSPVAGEFRGKRAVVDAITALADSLDDEPDVVIEEIANGPRLIAIVVRETARRAGRELEFRRVVTYRLTGDLINAIEIFHEDEYAVDEFFS